MPTPATDAIVIVAAARTPMGGFQGDLAAATAPDLGAAAIEATLARAGIEPARIDELLMGCVLPAGLGQAPARQAGFAAGLPREVPATTINKMCGSGMKAVMLAHDALRAGTAEAIVAGGMESMSNAPYLLPKMRAGARLGHAAAQDHMFLDGLEDAYEKGRLMGSFAEDCATEFQLRPRGAGRLRARLPHPRPRGPGQRRLRRRDRPGHARHPHRRDHRGARTNNPAPPAPRRSRPSNPPSARTAR